MTALCRIFARQGVRVAPFKAQNMSNNAGVCADGSEIGRAQITQAQAAGIAPTAAMNPVLLKPEANVRAQVVVMGKAWHTLNARDYYERKRVLWSYVTAALDALRAEHELIIIEGAGSPVELNLKQNDIVNMAVARYAQAPVLLVGDIDRGGIFAQLLGTLWLLPEEERQLVAGFVVNKFRGDPTLFTDGVRILEERGRVPVLGVVPWMADLAIPEEDAVVLERGAMRAARDAIEIAVIKLPRIANFDDFDPLVAEEGVNVRYVSRPEELAEVAAVIIPGTKSTMADLAWLRARGLAAAILEKAAAGASIVGICGGYQMLGRTIADPDGVESDVAAAEGLGLLAVDTLFQGAKETHPARGIVRKYVDNGHNAGNWLDSLAGSELTGYEIHMGHTFSESTWVELTERRGMPVTVLDGAASADGRIWGCYLHGLFANQNLRHAWLEGLGWRPSFAATAVMDQAFERLADHVAAAIDIDYLAQITGLHGT